MATSSTQRIYSAPCPGCGAPVEFRSAQSTYAVCQFCKSTVVRDGETLKRLGKVAEVFEDFSPLQLMAQGTWQGKPFTIVGRLQYKGDSGTWTEWIAMGDDGSMSVLAEDNGSYVFAVPATSQQPIPESSRFRLGGTTAISGKAYQVTSNEQVMLIAAQGELPKLPPLIKPFDMVELRSRDDEVLSVDYGSTPPVLSRGKPVLLDDLKLSGLKEDREKGVKGRQFACPSCGAPIEVQLETTKSLTCRACDSLIDLEGGVGGELRHAEQDEPVRPLIPLGSTGQLQGVQWQVVGFQHRLGKEPGDDDESFGWEEYLLYNQKRGFTFLVDSTDGWSIVKPATGAPALSKDMTTATYLGTVFQQQYAYRAETTYVAGEFYWPVRRGQTSNNRDYAKDKKLLSMEETKSERTWSFGTQIDSDAVATAFNLKDKKDLLKRGDIGPTTPGKVGLGCGCLTILIIFILIIILLAMLKACEDEESGSSGYRSSGSSSSGGYSGGGSHK